MGEIIIDQETYENAKKMEINGKIFYKVKGVDEESLITDFNRQKEMHYRRVIEEANRSKKGEFNYSASKNDCREIMSAARQLGYEIKEIGSEGMLGRPHFFHFTKKKNLEEEVKKNY